MSFIEIENKLRQMSNAERLVVIEAATKLIRNDLSKREPKQKPSMREAAELLREDYFHDSELTAFTSLDNEDFLNA